jgi:hypothetical protein
MPRSARLCVRVVGLRRGEPALLPPGRLRASVTWPPTVHFCFFAVAVASVSSPSGVLPRSMRAQPSATISPRRKLPEDRWQVCLERLLPEKNASAHPDAVPTG